MLKVGSTNRGFPLVKFTEGYGLPCSLQKSSIATQQCVWLGLDDPDPKILVLGEGWEPYPLPANVLVSTRMHLTQQMVLDLLPHLIEFAYNGEIQNPQCKALCGLCRPHPET